MFLAANWSTAWIMTGMGIGIVFLILCLLVITLLIFNAVAQKSNKQADAIKDNAAEVTASNGADASDLDEAAVATAIYLYKKSKGDNESGVLTINMAPSAWHAELNKRL